MRSVSSLSPAVLVVSCLWLALGTALARGADPAGDAKASFIEGDVKVSREGASTPLREGQSLIAGSRLQTAQRSLARIDFPLTTVLLSAATDLRLSDAELVLEGGRVEVSTRDAAVVKLVAADARISGEGWIVVRREENRVQLSAIDGRFAVQVAGKEAIVAGGNGLSVAPDAPRRVVALAERPQVVAPNADGQYFKADESFDLKWMPAGKAHLQILAIDSDGALIDRDVDGDSTSVKLPWPGLYRWRVASLGADGVEGAPSTEGLICILESTE